MRHLLEHCNTQGDMEIVENKICVGMYVELEVADAVATIGDERHLLVHGEGLADQQFVQPALWFPVVANHKSGTAYCCLLRPRFADDDFKVRAAYRSNRASGRRIIGEMLRKPTLS
jgi:hypothetical protein